MPSQQPGSHLSATQVINSQVADSLLLLHTGDWEMGDVGGGGWGERKEVVSTEKSDIKKAEVNT